MMEARACYDRKNRVQQIDGGMVEPPRCPVAGVKQPGSTQSLTEPRLLFSDKLLKLADESSRVALAAALGSASAAVLRVSVVC